MKSIKNSLLVVLGCVVVLLVWLWHNTQVRLSNYQEQVQKLEVSSQSFSEKLTKDSIKIVEQEQIILSQKDAIELGLLEVEKLKNIKSKVTVVTKTTIDSVFIPFETVLEVHDTIYHTGTIEVPKRFKLINTDYSINGIVLSSGINIDSLRLFNEMSVTIGEKRNGIFKKPTAIVEIQNSNSYLNTVRMNNVIIEKQKRFYDRPLFWGGIGLVTGIILTK